VKQIHFECSECARYDSADPNTPRGREQLCFRCHIQGVSFKFVGPTGGRESFHNETISQVTDDAVRSAREQGREIRPKNKVNGAFSAPKVAS
jgi:hypothetical protein